MKPTKHRRKSIKQHKEVRTPKYRERVVDMDYRKKKQDDFVKEQLDYLKD